MQVDFNGLRKNLAHRYNELTRSLHFNFIDHDDILSEMEELRCLIFSLLCLYNDDEGELNIKDLSDEIDLLSPYNNDNEDE
jgi:hypothetical protein